MQRQSVLSRLKKNFKASDFYLKGFAMLNCATSIKDHSLEGDTQFRALNYLSRIIDITCEACQIELFRSCKS